VALVLDVEGGYALAQVAAEVMNVRQVAVDGLWLNAQLGIGVAW
jgi:hypothetical protein